MTEYTRENMPDDLRWLAENVSEWDDDFEAAQEFCGRVDWLRHIRSGQVDGWSCFNKEQHASARQALGLGRELAESLPEGVEKYSPYFKDVRHIDTLDVYRVIDLFGCESHGHAISHAVKKLLLSGVRTGGKDLERDVSEAIDSLQRWMEMREEDGNG